MPPFEESGLRVTLPEEGSFRFSECPTYQRISGRNVSEMDVGWWEEKWQAIVLLEIKDYSTQLPRKDLMSSLLAKGRDCLVMLHAVWHGVSAIGKTLGADLPERCRQPQRLVLYFVLKVGTGMTAKELLVNIKESLENHVNAYAEVLGMRRITVILLDHEKAIAKGLPLSVL